MGQLHLPLLFILSNFVQLPLLYLGLSRNITCQFYASVIACLLICLCTNIPGGLFFFLISVGPSLVLTHFALHRVSDRTQQYTYSSGQIFSFLLLYMLGLLLFFMIFLQLNAQGALSYAAIIKGHLSTITAEPLKSSYQQWIDTILNILPFILSAAALMTTLINFFLTQSILVKTKKYQRPTPDLSSFNLPWWPWIALAVCGALNFILPTLQARLFLNAALLLLSGFLIEGLSIVHKTFLHYKLSGMFLWIFYFVMVLFGWPIFIVIVLGIFEPWTKLRERLTLQI